MDTDFNMQIEPSMPTSYKVYHKQLWRTLLVLCWVSIHCAHAEYVNEADDDMKFFEEKAKAQSMFETMNPAKFRRRYLGGSSDTHVAEQPGLFTDIHVEGRTGEYLRRGIAQNIYEIDYATAYHIFFENFENQTHFEEAWRQTTKEGYEGKFTLETLKDGAEHFHDHGLYVPEKAKRYGIASPFKKFIRINHRNGLRINRASNIVLQYEVAFTKGLECGGAYLKIFTNDRVDHRSTYQTNTIHTQYQRQEDVMWNPPDFEEAQNKLTSEGDTGDYQVDGDSRFAIMFGPDKCGDTNKVHLIMVSYPYQAPTYSNRIEHHLTKTIRLPDDRKTHLYSLEILPIQDFYAVYVDMQLQASGKLTEDFEPPFEPPDEIPDPTESKPADWIDQAMIPDMNATKPDDWDENQPMMIPDSDASLPGGWLLDEPERIPDPNATKPDDWDDEEDGLWTPNEIVNPKCNIGCGPWTPPDIPNPLYKGKWSAPMIDNPDYKGEWKPKMIPNPERYDFFDPHHDQINYLDLMPQPYHSWIGIGFEIWTMNEGLLFDNIYWGVGNVTNAFAFAEHSWMPKFEAQSVEDGTYSSLPWMKDSLIVNIMKAFYEETILGPYLIEPLVEMARDNNEKKAFTIFLTSILAIPSISIWIFLYILKRALKIIKNYVPWSVSSNLMDTDTKQVVENDGCNKDEISSAVKQIESEDKTPPKAHRRLRTRRD